MKRFIVPILVAALIITSGFAFTTYRQLAITKLQKDVAVTALVNYHGSAPIKYLFEHARNEPSKKNLAALTYALLERKSKYEALIQLSRPVVNDTNWAGTNQRPSEQAAVFFLNLSLQDQISGQDWATFDRIADTWMRHEEILKADISFVGISNPRSFAQQYLTLLQELNNVVPSK